MRPSASVAVSDAYTPYHDAIETALGPRLTQPDPVALCAVHTFTPVMRGVARPWHVGIVHHPGDALADRIIAILKREQGLIVAATTSPMPRPTGSTIRSTGTARPMACQPS